MIMRLAILDHGHRPVTQLIFNTIKRITGFLPGPLAINSYRRDLFGKDFSACIHEALRRPSAWPKTELELFASFVSRQLECQF
jgi:hypothetical protein